ncbi:MAG: NADH-quinone oxidoreductase subunit J [Anaerolineae bacterium]|nr:NADH-quinone oxidoreductase subunit J [Anaerolineae bacterium]MDW8100645.1 NADH-quinone oxidoreductase subunit J [Anaerolineae bacterium]
MEWLLFALFALAAIAGGVGVVLSRNAVHSALFLLLNFASMALLYLLLGAQFLAMAQILVYAGAIVVLFIFVVMLVGREAVTDVMIRGRLMLSLLAIVLAGLFLGGSAYALVSENQGAPVGAQDYGSVQSVGSMLYTRYLLPFEMVSVLLLAAMIGAIVLARRIKPPLGRPEE